MPVTEAAGARAARQRHRHAADDAVRHPRRDADPHVRPRPHDALRPARPRGDPHRAERAARSRADADHPAGYAPVCIGTTTSTRMERFTRPLMAQYGVRIIIGKGGLRDGIARGVPRAGRRLSRDHRRHRGARDHVDRGDRGRRPRRPESRNRCGSSASAISGRCWSRWTATAAACTTRSHRCRTRRRAQCCARLGVNVEELDASAVARLRTDILILGSGGAGLFAALHAHQADPTLVDHGRGQGPARQVRLHAHGPGRLQRRARRQATRSSATSWTRSKAASGCPTRTSRGRW